MDIAPYETPTCWTINENDYSNAAPGTWIGGDLGVDHSEVASSPLPTLRAYCRTQASVINGGNSVRHHAPHGAPRPLPRQDIRRKTFLRRADIPPFLPSSILVAPRAGRYGKSQPFLRQLRGIRQSQRQQNFSRHCAQPPRLDQVSCTEPMSPHCPSWWNPKIIPFLGLYPLPNAASPRNFSATTRHRNTHPPAQLTEHFLVRGSIRTFSEKNRSVTHLSYDNGPELFPDRLVNTLIRLNASRQLRESPRHTASLPCRDISAHRFTNRRPVRDSQCPINTQPPPRATRLWGYTAELSPRQSM